MAIGVHSYDKMPVNVTWRVYISVGVVLLSFGVLGLRLWYLQILNGDHFRVLSENNRRKTVYLPPPRGIITDRHGEVVVKNRPAFNIEFVSADSPDPAQTLSLLAEILGRDASEILTAYGQQGKRRRFEPKIIMKDVSRDTVAQVSAKSHLLPGVIVSHYPARDYIYGDFASHVIGYLREITKEQLESARYSGSGYRRGDLIGQYGLEMRWESFLQGRRGRREVIVNVRGVRIGELAFESAVRGNGIRLTIDRKVQEAADRALAADGKSGAVVAIDPENADILAMASSPRFDPNIFTREISAAEWADLVGGPEKRLNNRAVQGAYPPGSVFKAIMGTAGLAEGVVTPTERIRCPGFLKFGRRRYHCHKRAGHGYVNLWDALVVSCDVYFYIVGQRLGINGIHNYATRFGLGNPTGLELVHESPGLVPSTRWKASFYKGTEQEKWYPGETLSVAIGQGAMLTTPLQMASAVAALVNGGTVYQPQLVAAILSPDGRVIDDKFPARPIKKLKVDEKILSRIRDALIGVVNSPRGTARRAKIDPDLEVVVAGKTGTSQVVALSKKTDEKRFEHHAWFVGYAPAEKPEIVVAALIEHGGGGGKAAAPVVSQVLEAYFVAKRARRNTPSMPKSASVPGGGEA